MENVTPLKAADAEKACREITASLGDWYGTPEVNDRFAKGVKERLSFGYWDNGRCIALFALEFPYPHTANIFWMGVLKEFHGQRIAEALLAEAERVCLEENMHTLTIQTLSPKEEDSYYLLTFDFLTSMGFKPLFEHRSFGEDYLIVYLIKVLSPKIFTWVDLTHELSEKIPTWDGACGFKLTEAQEDSFVAQRIEMAAGIGTHIDAPLHCIPNGKSIAELTLDSLIVPCQVINLTQEAHEEYVIGLDPIKQYEKKYGSLLKNSFVLFYTGWDQFWDQPEKYRRFPSLSKETAEYLVSHDIAGIGIDTLSPDKPGGEYPVHQLLLGAGKYIVENIANAGRLPAAGGYIFALPIVINHGSEAPMRLLGMY